MTALTALLATTVTFVATLSGLVNSVLKSDAEVQVSFGRFDYESKRIWVSAWNDGDKTGSIQSFELQFDVAQTDGAKLGSFTEPLLDGDSKTGVLMIHGGETVTSSLQPDISNNHWKLAQAIARANPKLTADDAERQEEDLLPLLQQGGKSCRLNYVLSANKKTPQEDKQTLEIPDCGAFLRKVYAPD